MANNYIPFDLKLASVISKTAEAELVALRVDPCMSISTDDAARLIIYGKN